MKITVEANVRESCKECPHRTGCATYYDGYPGQFRDGERCRELHFVEAYRRQVQTASLVAGADEQKEPEASHG